MTYPLVAHPALPDALEVPMSLKITDPVGAVGRVQVSLTGLVTTEITHSDAQEALEDLARVLGFTLVDREERKSLLALTEEVDADDNDYDVATQAWVIWQDRAEALAEAVNGLFAVRAEG